MQKLIKNILILLSLSCAKAVFATEENFDPQEKTTTQPSQSIRRSVKPSILSALKEETDWQNRLAKAKQTLPENTRNISYFIELVSNRSFQRADHEELVQKAVTIQWGNKSINSWQGRQFLGLTYKRSELNTIQNYHSALFDRPLWTEDELKKYDAFKKIIKILELKKGKRNENTQHAEDVWEGKFSTHHVLRYEASWNTIRHIIATHELEALIDYHNILYPTMPPFVSKDIMRVRQAQQTLFNQFKYDNEIGSAFSIEKLVRCWFLDNLSDEDRVNYQDKILRQAVTIIDKGKNNKDAPMIISRKWINALDAYSQTLRGCPLFTPEQVLHYDATEEFLKTFSHKMSSSESTLYSLVERGHYSKEKGREEKKQILFVGASETYPQIERAKAESFERYAKALHPNNPLLTQDEWEKYDLQQDIFRSLGSQPKRTHLKAILAVDAGTYDINLTDPNWLSSFAELFPSTDSQSAFLLYTGTMNPEKYGFVIEEVDETSLEIATDKND